MAVGGTQRTALYLYLWLVLPCGLLWLSLCCLCSLACRMSPKPSSLKSYTKLQMDTTKMCGASKMILPMPVPSTLSHRSHSASAGRQLPG